jgi:serine/threonine-protein kinase RsbW
VNGDSRIVITFPAKPEFLRLARLTTADAASRAGFDYEEIDDLRIAVSELCALASGHDGANLTLDFALEPRGIVVRGAATPGAIAENELSRTIVTALVDDFEITTEGGSTRFRATKRMRSESPGHLG